jgi:preprotein translocase subunit SecA
MLNLIKKLFPSKHDRDVRQLQPYVELVNKAFDQLQTLTDDELRGKTAEFKQRIKEYTAEIGEEIDSLREQAEAETDIHHKDDLYNEIDELSKTFYQQLDEIMEELVPEAFAVVKETARRLTENHQLVVQANDYDRELAERFKSIDQHVEIQDDKAIWKHRWMAADSEVVWNMVPYDVQLMGGVVLHKGKIAEMATGEGKTLVATLPIYLNALTGLGVHLVTVNNYLARRDAEWNAPIFRFHGMTVDCIDLHQPNSDERRKAYRADITYGTNNEFGFDYLRDNMTTHPEYLVQRKHYYSIVDEIDSVLIDEARTPLIISGPVPRGDKHEFNELKPRIERLVRAQQKLITNLLSEAKKKIEAGNEKDEGGLALFRAYKGLPKYGPLIKFLSETGMRAVLNKTEGFYMQDNSKHMHIATDPLYFTIDEKNNQIELTDKGRELISESGEDPNLFVLPDVAASFSEIEGDSILSPEEKVQKKDVLARDFGEKSERLHAINQLLKAYTLFENDVDYIVQDDKVMIVDTQTGRVLAGRRYSDGLHQAIEAKENVKIEAATQTFATVTLQNYFRMYEKLAGMTGTAETEEAEFFEIYKLDVVVIPTNRPIQRLDLDDLVYRTKREKYNAVIKEIEKFREKGQPILVGTTSVEVSELLSRMLGRAGIPHNVLNAKHHQREAEIVAAAGQASTVTIATNMAGRGTDIKLGKGVVESGGLAIIGTERHESRRIDRQLRGRAGRQGDPGVSQFFVSLEDDLMRLFGSERVSKVMDRMGAKEGDVIQHSMISRSIGNAQKKVEENNFAMRKRLLEYDDVMNSQREVVYRRRRNALYGDRIKVDLDNMLFDLCTDIVARYYNLPDVEGMKEEILRTLSVGFEMDEKTFSEMEEEKVVEQVYAKARRTYDRRAELIRETMEKPPEFWEQLRKNNPHVQRLVYGFSDGNRDLPPVVVELDQVIASNGQVVVDEMEKVMTLNIIDNKWKDHLREMDELRQAVQNAVFEQKDPLLVYKFESFELFQRMLKEINRDVLSTLFKAAQQEEAKTTARETPKRDDFSRYSAGRGAGAEAERQRRKELDVMASASGEGEGQQPRNRKERRRIEQQQGGGKRESLAARQREASVRKKIPKKKKGK